MIQIAQLSDTHIALPGRLLKGGRVDPARQLAQAVEWLLQEHAVQPYQACVVSGDLVDSGRLEEYRLLKDLLEPLAGQMQICLALGNHDCLESFVQVFSGWQGHAPGPDGHQQRWLLPQGLQILVLDSLWPGHDSGRLGAGRLAWLDDQLAALKSESTETMAAGSAVVVVHHPPFQTGLVDFDAMGLEDSAELALRLQQAPEVGCVMSGHLHRSLVGRFAGHPAVVAPSTAFGYARRRPWSADGRPSRPIEPPGLALHRWDGQAWSVDFQPLPAIPVGG